MVVIQTMPAGYDDLGIAMSPSLLRTDLEAYRLGQEHLNDLQWSYN